MHTRNTRDNYSHFVITFTRKKCFCWLLMECHDDFMMSSDEFFHEYSL